MKGYNWLAHIAVTASIVTWPSIGMAEPCCYKVDAHNGYFKIVHEVNFSAACTLFPSANLYQTIYRKVRDNSCGVAQCSTRRRFIKIDSSGIGPVIQAENEKDACFKHLRYDDLDSEG